MRKIDYEAYVRNLRQVREETDLYPPSLVATELIHINGLVKTYPNFNKALFIKELNKNSPIYSELYSVI